MSGSTLAVNLVPVVPIQATRARDIVLASLPTVNPPKTMKTEFIYAYTRSEAIADGFRVEVTKTAREAGINFPVFLTQTVYDAYVTVPDGVGGQDEAGRLWDIVWMLRFAILRSAAGCEQLQFALYVRNDNHKAGLVKLVAICGPLDVDDPQPAITVVMADED